MKKKENTVDFYEDNDNNLTKSINTYEAQEIESVRGNQTDLANSLSISNVSIATSSNSLSYQSLSQNEDLLSIACANARSLVEKIESLVTLFEECGLHAAMITETWLSQKHCPPRTMADLTIGSDLNLIRKDR